MQGRAGTDRIETGQLIGAVGEDSVGVVTVMGLADVTRMSLNALSELDDALLDATLERLLPASGGMEKRFWGQESNIDGL
jgi:hypothetical protein